MTSSQMLIPLIGLSLVGACSSSTDEQNLVGNQADESTPTAEGDATLTIVPPGFERAAGGPGYLFHVRSNIFAAVDPIDAEVIFIDDRGKGIGAADLPPGFSVRDVEIGEQIVLRGDESAVVIKRDVALGGQLKLTGLPDPRIVVERVDGTLLVRYARAAGVPPLSIIPVDGGRVLAATFLGLDNERRPYAYWEQSAGNDVRVLVGRFNERGYLDSAAPIDLREFANVPALPVALEPSGQILLMRQEATGIQLSRITLPEGREGEAETQDIGPAPTRTLDVGGVELIDDSRFALEPLVRDADEYDPAFASAALARARAYLDARWTLNAANFRQPSIPHRCAPPQAKWLRPSRLTASQVGKEVKAIPYKWGGFDTVDGFKSRLARNPALAGDVCTCRQPAYGYCTVARAAGVDCSGFVSRAWGLRAHHGTTRLGSLADRLPSLTALRPGDALNRPGNHVRLVVRIEPGVELRIRTLESSVSCGGVCEEVYNPSQLEGYRPLRLRQTQD